MGGASVFSLQESVENYGCFLTADAGYDEAEAVLLGVPMDYTVSYRPGSRFGPQAIRAASVVLEEYSPALDRELGDCRICDLGDLVLPFGNVAKALDLMEQAAARFFADRKRPCFLGGEHLVSLPLIRAAHAMYPDLVVLHFDAHADLKRDFRGEAFSDLTLMRRVWDILGDGRIYQFGVRSGSREEFEWSMEHTRIETGSANSIDSCAEAVLPRPIYITVDLDVLDPAEFPATGTPEAGGMSFRSLYDALLSLRGFDVVGFDICGLYPPYDTTGVSTSLAVKLLREMLIAFS